MSNQDRLEALEERVALLERAIVVLVGGAAEPEPDELAEKWSAARAKFGAAEGHA